MFQIKLDVHWGQLKNRLCRAHTKISLQKLIYKMLLDHTHACRTCFKKDFVIKHQRSRADQTPGISEHWCLLENQLLSCNDKYISKQTGVYSEVNPLPSWKITRAVLISSESFKICMWHQGCKGDEDVEAHQMEAPTGGA